MTHKPVLAFRSRRHDNELSQNKLAKKSGVSRSAIATLENGFWLPSLITASRLAAALDCTVDDIARDFGIHPSQIEAA